jgi:hypothetical protein
MQSDRAVIVTPDPAQPLTFDVRVREGRGESRHRVTIPAEDADRYAASGVGLDRCVEAAMAFLLDREPKESILGAFDIQVIRRYFPEFDEAFPAYLARLGEATRTGRVADRRPPREKP